MQKKKIKPNKIDLVIFDVNQTMFSLNALKVKFKEFRLKQSLVNSWFLSVLKEGFSNSLSQKFVNFKTIGKNELIKIFLQNNTPYNNKTINSIFEEFGNLKVHPIGDAKGIIAAAPLSSSFFAKIGSSEQ